MRLLRGYNKAVVALAVTPDGSRLFTAAKGQSMVWEWDLSAGTVARKIKGRGNALMALAVSPAGDALALSVAVYGIALMPLDGETAWLDDTTGPDHTGHAWSVAFD